MSCRASVVLPAALCLVLAATLVCADGPPSATDKAMTGRYSCTITSDQFTYPNYSCRISLRDGRLWLEKLTGSQRFKGTLAPTPAGYHFDGTYFCPYGDCTAPSQGDFARTGPREWAGGISSGVAGLTMVTLVKTSR
jgi:hypothetical protein